MLRVLRELRDGDAEDDEQVDVPLEGELVIPRAQAFRAGAARGQTILRKRQEGETAAASQSLQQPPPGPDTSGGGARGMIRTSQRGQCSSSGT